MKDVYAIDDVVEVVCQDGEAHSFKLVSQDSALGCGPCSARCDRTACDNLGLTCSKVDNVVWERISE